MEQAGDSGVLLSIERGVQHSGDGDMVIKQQPIEKQKHCITNTKI